MRGSWKAVVGGAVVAGVVLVPLYGDPHRSPVSHSEWARMLLKGLDMDNYLPKPAQASQVFAVLSWKNTLSYAPDRYLRADGVDIKTADGKTVAVASGTTPGEIAYPVAVVREGNYELRVKATGKQPLATEFLRTGDAKPAGTYSVVPEADGGWVFAGRAHLDPGSYSASISLPPGASLETLEIVPPCLRAIEPPGGWRATAVATTSEVAATVIQALDKESELPGSAAAIELLGSDFQLTSPSQLSVSLGENGATPTAGPQGLKAMVFVNVPEAGLYTISVLGTDGRGGQSWLGDGCQKAVLCPRTAQAASGPQWRVLETTEFAAGRHFFNVHLGAGASIARLRLEKRKDGPEDYLETLKRLGLDLGSAGPIARDKAVEAMNYVRLGRAALLEGACGDVLTAAETTLLAQGQGGPLPEPPGPVVGPGVPPATSGQGPPPLTPPAAPPQIPASPVTP